jgi:hypothetical protein
LPIVRASNGLVVLCCEYKQIRGFLQGISPRIDFNIGTAPDAAPARRKRQDELIWNMAAVEE